jgi:hypothetical protein
MHFWIAHSGIGYKPASFLFSRTSHNPIYSFPISSLRAGNQALHPCKTTWKADQMFCTFETLGSEILMHSQLYGTYAHRLLLHTEELCNLVKIDRKRSYDGAGNKCIQFSWGTLLESGHLEDEKYMEGYEASRWLTGK